MDYLNKILTVYECDVCFTDGKSPLVAWYDTLEIEVIAYEDAKEQYVARIMSADENDGRTIHITQYALDQNNWSRE